MTASAEERATRRYKELIEKGEDVVYEDVLKVTARLATDPKKTADEYAMSIKDALALHGEEASEIKVLDVLIVDDSIYAKSNEKVYAAHLEDNIVDYRYWKTRTTSSPRFDTKKGISSRAKT